ncbi:bacterial proteasome activator family protein [Kitasatospora sp. NPDC056783]|uniref:bacterial proteasome activator family protein n=1 Tax=Kitasatospora sp. NPDC056783 TaxID=3345943 RepID=UPI0036A67FDE
MTNPMNERPSQEPFRATGGQSQDGQKVLIVGPDGLPVGQGFAGAAGGGDDEDDVPRELPVTEMVEQPAKVMRIGSMIKQLLEEVRAAPLDEASRVRLKDIHASSIKELELGLAPELVAELERLSLPFTDDTIPTEAELRIAQAQLVGWLEGLFHGIQTALFAQQMAARAQLEQMRRALPPGLHSGEVDEEDPGQGRGIRSGPYL